MIRAAVLAARMSLAAVEPLDVMRYLNVPAIVWILRRAGGRVCRDERHRRRRRRRG